MRQLLKKIVLLGILLMADFALYASAESPEEFDKPYGEQLRIEYLLLVAVIAFVILKLLGIGKRPPAPVERIIRVPSSAPAPKAKPMMQQVSDTVGDLEEIGKGTYVGSKMVSERGDVQTYLMLAQVDRAQIRREERARAQEAIASYEKRFFYMKVAIGVLLFLFIVFSAGTFADWFMAAKEFIELQIEKYK